MIHVGFETKPREKGHARYGPIIKTHIIVTTSYLNYINIDDTVSYVSPWSQYILVACSRVFFQLHQSMICWLHKIVSRCLIYMSPWSYGIPVTYSAITWCPIHMQQKDKRMYITYSHFICKTVTFCDPCSVARIPMSFVCRICCILSERRTETIFSWPIKLIQLFPA